MFHVVIVIILVGLSSVTEASEQPEWLHFLKPYLSRIASENAGVAALSNQADATRSFANAEGALPDPMIGVGIQALPTDGNFNREPMTQAPLLSVRQVIPYPGKLAAKSKAKKAESIAFAAKGRVEIESSGLELAFAIFQHSQLGDELFAVEETIKWFELLLNSVEARYRTGRGLHQDVDQLRVEIGRLKAAASKLRAAQTVANTRWGSILQAPAPQGAQLSNAEKPWLLADNVTETVLSGNPTLAVKMSQLQVSRERVSEARNGYGPDMAVELGYGVRRNDRRDFLTAKFGLSVPLWARWSHRNKVDGANKSVASADLELSDTRAGIIATLDGVLAMHQDASDRQRLYEESILPDSKAAQQSARAAYESGGADIFVPIAATGRELMSRREYARVLAERRHAEAIILALEGRLVGEHGPVGTQKPKEESEQ